MTLVWCREKLLNKLPSKPREGYKLLRRVDDYYSTILELPIANPIRFKLRHWTIRNTSLSIIGPFTVFTSLKDLHKYFHLTILPNHHLFQIKYIQAMGNRVFHRGEYHRYQHSNFPIVREANRADLPDGTDLANYIYLEREV